MSEYGDLYRKFSILPNNEEVFRLAFTHSSYNGTVGTRNQDYERLEFLGDAVVGMVVSELCFRHHPEMKQGDLSVLKAQFIRTQSEASYCLKLGLDKYIRVGASFQGLPSDNPSLLEDVFEAFVGALLLDQGLNFTYKFLKNVFEEDISKGSIHTEQNPKSALQEAMQAEHKESVTYKIIAEHGPSHDRSYEAGVYFEGVELGRGSGRSKKIAETEAARDALSKMASPSK